MSHPPFPILRRVEAQRRRTILAGACIIPGHTWWLTNDSRVSNVGRWSKIPNMKNKFSAILALIGMAWAFSASAQDSSLSTNQLVQLAKSLQYRQGEIKLQNGMATLNVPTNFYFLDAKDARTVLVQFWDNPPAQADGVLGLLIPSNVTPLDPDCWAVTVSYSADGYVKDGDAGKINYDDLLKKMKADVESGNKARTDKGYPAIHLVGWAAPPHYDADTHKLYWAKEASFEGAPENTLNYDIRILGRRGYLVLTAIAGMHQLPEIEKQTPQILSMVDFNQGNRYADFDPKIDKVATYGIAALVAGGIAAKLGLFKLILVFLVAAKKFIIIALAAVAAWFRKIFKGRSNNPPGAPTA